jgi:uncharacterized protein YqeY
MTLHQTIVEDLKRSMKEKDVCTRDTLRSLDSMIKNEEIAQKKREEGLEDDGVIALVKRAIKQRKDSVEQYHLGNREDLVQKEQQEIAVLEKYLPEQMSVEDVEKIVLRVISDLNAVSKNDMGKVMGVVMKEVGDMTDGNVVKKIVEEQLSH